MTRWYLRFSNGALRITRPDDVEEFQPPGTHDHQKGKDRRTGAFWKITFNPEMGSEPDSDEHLASEFLELLEDAVRLHLRSDVPVGTCLSGGLDSSTLVALIDRAPHRNYRGKESSLQDTFSACFEDTV